ncbi:SDR family oxidoreductase [Mucilaginibacter gynuensis]|uniref:SDR family oxidoreductase n=1 Tax=Mucilaginibacter gynuensis TaxID=1302236 RepID=A0ABP8FYJ9_9SPHI
MKTIILTGSNSGFGLLTVQTLAKQGHKVYATMRNVTTKNAEAAKDLSQWAADNNVQIKIIELDVNDDASVEKAMAEIAADAGGKIDVLINNAGTGFIGLNESLSPAQTNQIFQINVLAADRMIKGALPYMHLQKDGLILTISSVGARQPMPVMGVYAATKAAIDNLSASYYYELRSAGIDVAIVQPGVYPATDIVAKQLVPAKPNVEQYYGEDILNFQKGVFKAFIPNENSPSPQEVADLIASIIDTPKGSRKLWNIVGGGPLAAHVDNINQATGQLVETILGATAAHAH